MDVSAFKGYRYDDSVVGDAANCVAPPYDVIDADEQEILHARSEYNIVRVIKGISKASDSESDNIYTRAAGELEAYARRGAIKQDDSERIYVYAQDFEIGGKSYRRAGFVGLGKLEEYGGSVKPHEQTMVGPKADRLYLMRATRSQIGQIFVLYSDPAGAIDFILAQAAQAEPLLKHTDGDGVDDLFSAECVPAETGACCVDMGGIPTPWPVCVETTPDECYGKGMFFEGVGTTCDMVSEACCLPWGYCVQVGPECCAGYGQTVFRDDG